MQIPTQQLRFTVSAIAVLLMTGWSAAVYADSIQLTLSGNGAVPSVKTKATGSGTIIIAPNKSISGTIKTKGIDATMAHIHSGKPGETGPVVVPLDKSGNDAWVVPKDTKLTDEAYKAFEAGNLYVNVHSKAHPDGELRAQLPAKAAYEPPVRSSMGGGGGGY